jgi:hypothetical protein
MDNNNQQSFLDFLEGPNRIGDNSIIDHPAGMGVGVKSQFL